MEAFLAFLSETIIKGKRRQENYFCFEREQIYISSVNMAGYQCRDAVGLAPNDRRAGSAGRVRMRMAKNSTNATAKDNVSAKDGAAASGLNAKMQEAIGRSLRAHYDDLIHAPVPDKFLELLARLEATERKARRQGGQDERG